MEKKRNLLLSTIIVLVAVLIITTLLAIHRDRTILAKPFNLLVRRFEYNPSWYSEDEMNEIIPRRREIERLFRNEDVTLTSNDMNKKHPGSLYLDKPSEFWNGWHTKELRLLGVDREDNLEEYPIIRDMLERNPEIISAFFSVLEPGKHIPPHVGPYEGIHRYHIGVCIPDSDDVWMKLDGKKYKWENGKGMMFNECYVHEVMNGSDERRVIMFMDIKRKFSNWWLNVMNECGLWFIKMWTIYGPRVREQAKRLRQFTQRA